MKRRIRRGRHLVPEAALTAKFQEALATLTADAPGEQLGDYLEFGVYNGTSLSYVHQATSDLRLEQTRLFGFDPFAGTPDEAAYDDDTTWMPGALKSEIGFIRESSSLKRESTGAASPSSRGGSPRH